MTNDALDRATAARRGRASQTGVVLAGLLALAGGCDEGTKRIPTPIGRAEGNDFIARVAADQASAIASLPDTAAAWCHATSDFHVAPRATGASGAGGPVFVAKSSVKTTPGLDGLAIFGGLAL